MFSIIIPTWNNLQYVQNCVRSIQKNSRYEHEIILHINGGSDGSLQWAEQEGIKHTRSPENIGICLAVNEAAGLSTTQYILYMNDDMYVLPNWDTALVDQIPRENTSPFVLSGTMIEPKSTNNPCVIVANHGDSLEAFDEQGLLAGYAAYPHADWAGASWPPTLVHRRWWQMVGGYSTELSPGMASDTDFAMKMWAAGCRDFHGVAASRIYHFQCRSTGRVRKNDGGAQFLSKWGMTQSMFSKHYLRRGQVYSGPCAEPDAEAMKFHAIKSTIKRRFGKLFTPFY